MKIISVVGARPNFIKLAPFVRAVNEYKGKKDVLEHIIVHTGQHYDIRMSEVFFDTLNIPHPNINLEVGSGTHAEQVGKTMIEFEKVLIVEKPDWVVVFGDVNATLACSVTAKKLQIKCCHVEAGLRSFDNSMPEEINRLVTDRLCDLLLVPDKISYDNLLSEGTDPKRMNMVGNIMIDSLNNHIKDARKISREYIINSNLLDAHANCIVPEQYQLITLHRPSNVDNKEWMVEFIQFITENVSKTAVVIWPIHPRTQKSLKNLDLLKKINENPQIILLQPIDYLSMINLIENAKVIITDSGGIQEEATVLNTPCITLRKNTERPMTLIENGGSNNLAGTNFNAIRKAYQEMLENPPEAKIPEKWDGNTAKRCVSYLLNFKENKAAPFELK